MTAAAAILQAAMGLFAERGVAAVSVRDVAAAAGVSSSLVTHHYATKRGLKDAADARALAALDDVFELGAGEDTAEGALASMQTSLASQLQQVPLLMPYLRRLLIDGGPAADVLFGRLLESTRHALGQWQQAGIMRRGADDDVLTAMVLVNDLATILLREQIYATLGFDPVQGAGLQRWAATALEMYRQEIFSPPAGPERDETPRSGR